MESRKLGNIYGFDGGNYAGNVYDKNNIAPTLTNMQGGNRQPMIIDDTQGFEDEPRIYGNISPCLRSTRSGLKVIDKVKGLGFMDNETQQIKVLTEQSIVRMIGRNPENPSDRTVGAPTEQRLEPNSQGICNTLTSVQKDNLVMEGRILQLPRGFNKGGEHKICPPITSHSFQENNFLNYQYRIRKLTPRECYRLMAVPEKDIDKMLEVNSNTQCYKQAGNSIVVNCLIAIFSQMGIQGIPRWNEGLSEKTNKGVDTMMCPCKGCTDREVGGCHDNCKKYKKWRAELDKRKSVIREKQAEINLTRSYVRDRLEEHKRRHR